MNCPANKDDHEERHLHLKTQGTWGKHVGHGDTWDTGEKGDTEDTGLTESTFSRHDHTEIKPKTGEIRTAKSFENFLAPGGLAWLLVALLR